MKIKLIIFVKTLAKCLAQSYQYISVNTTRVLFEDVVIWVGKIRWRSEKLPTLVFWPGEFQGLYGPGACKESDTTE